MEGRRPRTYIRLFFFLLDFEEALKLRYVNVVTCYSEW
jgi:hypothetical protein